jgi:hypothetical protein
MMAWLQGFVPFSSTAFIKRCYDSSRRGNKKGVARDFFEVSRVVKKKLEVSRVTKKKQVNLKLFREGSLLAKIGGGTIYHGSRRSPSG